MRTSYSDNVMMSLDATTTGMNMRTMTSMTTIIETIIRWPADLEVR